MKLRLGRIHGVRLCPCLAILLPMFFAAASAGVEPHAILLWPNGAPGSKGNPSEEMVRVNEYGEHIVSNVHQPSITPYLPAGPKSNATAVIIAPGGGHRELWMDHEGYTVAKWLRDHGVAAFVLKYRLAHQQGSTYTVEGDELADVQRAIRIVRSRAAKWGINPEHIGMLGFSAGGELAALAGTRYDKGNLAATDAIDRQSSRPDFQALLYPAIPKEMKLSKDTPPAFLICGEDDRTDIAQGLPELYLKLKQAGVSAELHIFAKTGHGFGMRASNQPPVSSWPQLFIEWLDAEGFPTR